MIRRSNTAVHSLREMLNGSVLRTMMDIKDAGEAFLARAKDIAGGVHYNTTGDADVWVNYIDETTGYPGMGRLHIPGNILFAVPDEDDTCMVVRPRGVNAPGASYVFHGDGGSKERFPSWIASKVGLFTRKVLRLESKDEAVEVQAGSGKDITLNGGSAKVTRVGDDIDMGTFTFLPNAGTSPAVLKWTPPNGGPPVTIATPLAGGTNLIGKAKTGAPNVKA